MTFREFTGKNVEEAIRAAMAEFESDLGFQNLWETSRVQPGEAGIITDYLGSKPGLGDAKSALDAFRADLPKMSQKMADSVDPNAVTSWFWSVYPFTLGSYASAKTGQYTTLLDVVAEPALHSRLLFAGEHTMAESKANRAAAALAKGLALKN